MQTFEVFRGGAAAALGAVLLQDLGPGLRKGTVLEAGHLDGLELHLRSAGPIHVLRLDPEEVGEDEAAIRLARALLGPGLRAQPPRQSQARLVAAHRGLLRVDAGALDRINSIPAISVFTLYDGQAVDAGEEVAGCKITPVAVAAHALEAAEAICRQRDVIRLLPFRPMVALVAATERLNPRARGAFFGAVRRKLGWYGARIIGVREIARAADAARSVYREARERDAELVVVAGSSVIDPLDPAMRGLAAEGGEVLRAGIPAHPGSMMWVGRLGSGTPVIGVATCSGFGRDTALDLVLPIIFAEGEVAVSELIHLGHGGLIERSAGRRFPPVPQD